MYYCNHDFAQTIICFTALSVCALLTTLIIIASASPVFILLVLLNYLLFVFEYVEI